MYRIGMFSDLCRVSVKNLRYYDEIGLLTPEYTDPDTNYRYYTTEQLTRIHTIRAYQQVGLSISEIKLLLRGGDEDKVLEKRQQSLTEELSKIQGQLQGIAFLRSGELEERQMGYRAVVKEIPGCIIYAKKMVLGDYTDYFTVVPPLGQAVTELNPDMQCAPSGYNFVAYLDGEYRETGRHIEFCEAVDRFGAAPPGVEFRRIDPVTVVSVMHRGPYATLGLAYSFAATWVATHGYVISGPPRESFIDGIWNKDSQDDWLTEVQIPILK